MNIQACFGGKSTHIDLYPVPSHARVAAQSSPLAAKVKGLFEHLKSPRVGESKLPLNFESPQLGERLLAVLNQRKPLFPVLRRIFGSESARAAKGQVKTDAAGFVAKAVGILLANQCQVTPQAIQSVLLDIRESGTHPSFNAPSWSRYVDTAIAEVQNAVHTPVSQPAQSRVAVNHAPFFEFQSSNGHWVGVPASAEALFEGVHPQRIHTLAKALERKIDREIAELKNFHVVEGDDWGLYIEKNNVALRMSASLCADTSLELLGQVPAFVAQLVKAKLEDPAHYKVWYQPEHGAPVELRPNREFKAQGTEFRTKALPALFEELEQAVKRNVARSQKMEFRRSSKPQEPSTALIAQLHKTPLGQRYPEIVEPMVRSVLTKQALAFLPANDPRPGGANKFRGGYLKKGNLEGITQTRVKAASGQVYALLNTLSPAAAQALKHQHGLDKQDKVILGQGAYGKVRLAMNVDTGQIVAVKKFLPDEQKTADRQKGRLPDVEANVELAQLDLVKHQLKGREKTNLASYLDYAHVTLPHIQGAGGETVGKSYIFMDLANAGDGQRAIDKLRGLRTTRHQDQALSLFVSIAKSYTRSLRDLHQLGFSHRDVKPANFLHAQGQNKKHETIRLADFGMIAEQQHNQHFHGGTRTYMPPEAKRIDSLRDERKALRARGAPVADIQAVEVQLAEVEKHYSAKAHDAYSLGKTLQELKQAALGGSTSSIQHRASPKGLDVLNNVITRLMLDDPKQRMSVAVAARLLNV